MSDISVRPTQLAGNSRALETYRDGVHVGALLHQGGKKWLLAPPCHAVNARTVTFNGTMLDAFMKLGLTLNEAADAVYQAEGRS